MHPSHPVVHGNPAIGLGISRINYLRPYPATDPRESRSYPPLSLIRRLAINHKKYFAQFIADCPQDFHDDKAVYIW